MHEAVIGLGSNLGSRGALLEAAAALLDGTPGVEVCARSARYETPPLGPAEHDFYNAALRVRFAGTPRGLLDLLLDVEARLGRVRTRRWGPRTLDLDLLWWDGPALRAPGLCVPHPHLAERNFALAPLLDVAPELAGTYGAALEQAGGRPAGAAWPAPPQGLEALVSAEYTDAAEAVAAAASFYAAHMTPHARAERTLAWDPRPRAGRLDAALSQLTRALQWGFVPCAAVVLEAGSPGWTGRLVGWYAGKRVPRAAEPPALQLLQGDDAGRGPKLSLCA